MKALAKNDNCHRGARLNGIPRPQSISRLFPFEFDAVVEVTNEGRGDGGEWVYTLEGSRAN